jgi:hypothetical protein
MIKEYFCMLPPQLLNVIAHKRRALMTIAGTVLLSSILFAACSGFGGGDTATSTSTPTSSPLTLAKLHWCNKATILFRDEHAPVTITATSGTPATGTPTASATASTPTPPPSGPTSVTNWSQVEPNLGFTVYLPKSLPANTCLVSASGTFHDPIFGGSFSIGYLLPNHSSITLAEAPERSNSLSFQCSPSGSPAPKAPQGSAATTPTASATTTPLLLCTGVRSGTNIVFSAPGSQATLQQFFNNLQPNVSWVPTP